MPFVVGHHRIDVVFPVGAPVGGGQEWLEATSNSLPVGASRALSTASLWPPPSPVPSLLPLSLCSLSPDLEQVQAKAPVHQAELAQLSGDALLSGDTLLPPADAGPAADLWASRQAELARLAGDALLAPADAGPAGDLWAPHLEAALQGEEVALEELELPGQQLFDEWWLTQPELL